MKKFRFGAYVTVGGAQHRTVHGIEADMSWLGAPPTEAQSRRYDTLRVGKHLAAISPERAELDRLAVSVATTFCESPTHQARVNAELADVHRKISQLCNCDICRRAS